MSEVVRTQEILALPLNGRTRRSRRHRGAAVRRAKPTAEHAGRVAYSVAAGSPSGCVPSRRSLHNDPQKQPDPAASVFGCAAGVPRGHERPDRRKRDARGPLQRRDEVVAPTASGNVFEFLRDIGSTPSTVCPEEPDGKLRTMGWCAPVRRDACGPLIQTALLLRCLPGNPGSSNAGLEHRVFRRRDAGGRLYVLRRPLQRRRQLALRGGFDNNRIDAARFSPAALNLVKRLRHDTSWGKLPNHHGRQYRGQAIGRIDYQWPPIIPSSRYMATSSRTDAPDAIRQRAEPLNTSRAAAFRLAKLAQSLAVGEPTSSAQHGQLPSVCVQPTASTGSTHRCSMYALGSNVFSYDPGAMVLAVTGGFNVAIGGGVVHHDFLAVER